MPCIPGNADVIAWVLGDECTSTHVKNLYTLISFMYHLKRLRVAQVGMQDTLHGPAAFHCGVSGLDQRSR